MISRPWSWLSTFRSECVGVVSRQGQTRWGTAPGRRAAPPRRARPSVEQLEDRMVLSPSSAPPLLAEVEPNDTQPSAMPIPLDVVVDGTISSPNDVDFFRIDVTGPGALTASVELPAGSPLDPRLALQSINSHLFIDRLPVGGGAALAASD